MESILAMPRWHGHNRVVGLLTTTQRQIASWRRRAEQRRSLAMLDNRMLADIGLTPAERDTECGKHFWRL
jgi:uncharacterized protein YjiS (DUF1127 family)